MKRRSLLVLILSMWLVLSVSAQSRSPIDLVLLLDTSSALSGYYYDVSDYLTGPFLREFLRIGDTFHLISFAGTVQTELSRRVEGQGDVQTVIGRMLLMYPLNPSSDLAAALNYTEHYVSALPTERQKKVILITEGEPDTINPLIAESSGHFRNSGADFQFIKVRDQIPKSSRAIPALRPPETVAAQLAQPPVQSTPVAPAAPTQTKSAQAVPAAPAAPAQTRPTQATQPPVQPPPAAPAAPAQTRPTQVAQPPAQSTPAAPAVPPPAQTKPTQAAQLPAQVAPSAVSAAPVQTRPTQPAPAAPAASPKPRQEQAGGGFVLPSFLLIGLGLLAVAILALIVFFMIRRLHSSPGHAMAHAASGVNASPYAKETLANDAAQTKRNADMLLGYAVGQRRSSVPPPSINYTEDKAPLPGGPVMLNLFVADQNTAIGRRNIHFVKSGYTFSIGGGRSDFLIFLVPVPPRIAEVRYDGNTCTFYPRRPEFFPDLGGSQPVTNCIGKTIRVISEKGYELFIRIERYEDPLIALNRLLTSIIMPSMPGVEDKISILI
jgi:hypothetical protein